MTSPSIAQYSNTNKLIDRVGGNLTVISCKDTATYDSDQKNLGFNTDIALEGTSSSISVNGGKTDLTGDSKMVSEQTGLFAQEADLIFKGKGSFIGVVFIISEKAQSNSNIVFKQSVTSQHLL